MYYYRNKRIKSGLSKSDIAKELELDYERYDAIERGDLKMPSKLLDKFNSIIHRGIENKIISEGNSKVADEFWEEVSKKTGDKKGEYVLADKMKEFNISSYRQLSKLLGYNSTSLIAGYLTGYRVVSGEFKKRLYNFFSDENNIQIPTKKVKRAKPIRDDKRRNGVRKINSDFTKTEIKELDDFYKNTDFKKILVDNGLLGKDVCKQIPMDKGYFSHLCNKKCKPSYFLLRKVKECFNNLTTTADTEIAAVERPKEELPTFEMPDLPELVNYDEPSNTVELEEENEIEKVPSVISRYASELNDITELMHEYQTKLNELEIRRKTCIEVLDAISDAMDEYTGGEK